MPNGFVFRVLLLLTLCGSAAVVKAQTERMESLLSFRLRHSASGVELTAQDVQLIPGYLDSLAARPVELVGMGYGLEHKAYSDYQEVDFAGRVVLIWRGQPRRYTDEGLLFRLFWPRTKAQARVVPLVEDLPEMEDLSTAWELKVYRAYAKGALGVLLVDSNLESIQAKGLQQLNLEGETPRPFFVAWIHPSTLDSCLDLPPGTAKRFWRPLPPAKWNKQPREIKGVAIPKTRFELEIRTRLLPAEAIDKTRPNAVQRVLTYALEPGPHRHQEAIPAKVAFQPGIPLNYYRASVQGFFYKKHGPKEPTSYFSRYIYSPGARHDSAEAYFQYARQKLKMLFPEWFDTQSGF